jgi:UDP-N-acetylglucosamine 4-epimerase
LLELVNYLKTYLADFDSEIAKVEVKLGPNRKGDIPHSLASVDKAKVLLNYNPTHPIEKGIKEAVLWYWENLK